MNDFSADQKRYLEGFVSGVQAARSAQGLAPIGGGARGGRTPRSTRVRTRST